MQDEDPENLVLMVFGAALGSRLLDVWLKLALILNNGEGQWHLAIKDAGAIDGQAHPEGTQVTVAIGLELGVLEDLFQQFALDVVTILWFWVERLALIVPTLLLCCLELIAFGGQAHKLG